MHSFDSALLPEELLLASLGSLAERGTPIPRPALHVVLGGKDRGTH